MSLINIRIITAKTQLVREHELVLSNDYFEADENQFFEQLDSIGTMITTDTFQDAGKCKFRYNIKAKCFLRIEVPTHSFSISLVVVSRIVSL